MLHDDNNEAGGVRWPRLGRRRQSKILLDMIVNPRGGIGIKALQKIVKTASNITNNCRGQLPLPGIFRSAAIMRAIVDVAGLSAT